MRCNCFNSLLVHFSLFISNWRQYAVVYVLEVLVIKQLDVIEHVLTCGATYDVCSLTYPLSFQ